LIRDDLLQLWPDEDAVASCIKHEAETVDKAVFLAVHQPMRFLRYGQGAKRGTQDQCTEQDLLDEFLHEKLPEGRLILPIEGSSGVGKSHVIRWIDAQLEKRRDRNARHVIRVPKGMSLKGVLRRLLEGLEGPRYDDLRTQLLHAREKLEPELAARHLILSICHRLEREAEAAAERIRDGKGAPEDKLAKTYGDKRALPALIGDSELLHTHWLRRDVDNTKGVMARLAEQVTEEAEGPEDTRLHQIRPEDLTLPQELVDGLNQTSGGFYQRLHGGRGDRLEDAARLINRVLDAAKQDLLQLGDGSLTDLFRAVREELFHDGKELVLLVEDFAVLSGMQGALLQVMITEAYRDGVQVLCTMRSALAYTEGVAHVPETVRTRARSRWVIEDQPGDSDDIHGRVVELVGAYLNAARVGQGALGVALEEGGEGNWIPIVDGEGLEDDARAVLEAFGSSEAGYPLFPFNRNAVRRLTEQGSRKDGALVFNPRNVINNVLTKVLGERSAFEEGKFPHKALAEDLRSAEVTNTVARSIPDPVTQQRALTLVACWGDQPNVLGEAAAIPDALFTAFGVPQPSWGVAPLPPVELQRKPESTKTGQGPRRDSVVPSGPRVSSKEQQWRDALEAWGAGSQLGQRHAAQLRKWVAQAMLEYVPWGALPLKPRQKADKLAGYVYLARSRGQGGVEVDGAFLVVAREEDLDDPASRADVIRQLMAFVRLHDVHGSWTYEGALQDAALCSNFLEARAERASAHVRSHHFRSEADTVPALTQTLLVGARALGVDGADSRQLPRRVAALLGTPAPPAEGADTAGGRDLARFADHREAIRGWLLEQVGARQGGGTAVHAVDVTALEPAIRDTSRSWTLALTLPDGENDRSYKSAAAALKSLRSDLPKTLRERRADLLEWVETARQCFGENPDKDELSEALRETLTLARKHLPLGYDPGTLRRRITTLKECALKTALSDCTRLEEGDDPGLVLSVLARNPDPVVRATRELMAEFDAFEERYAREVQTRLAQQGEDAVGEGATVVRNELGQIRALLGALQEARS